MAAYKTDTIPNEATASMRQALRDAEAATASSFVQAIEQLAGAVKTHADVHAVYGAPVTQQGVTVIPVARVVGGFGAGTGHGPAHAPAGSGGIGGGGGFVAMPVGFIELDRDGARFRPLAGEPESMGRAVQLALRLAQRSLRGVVAALRRRRTTNGSSHAVDPAAHG